MQVLVRLVHAEPGSRVVEASAQQEGRTLASALGEAASAEMAEDRARERLQRQLGPETTPRPRPQGEGPAPRPREAEEGPPGAAAAPVAPAAAPEPPQVAPEPSPPTVEEPPPDPEDWSSELAQVDLELLRIGWQRPEEATYLERAFSHPSRSRITTYADLMAYLEVLKGLAQGSDPARAPVPLRRPELLGQCDQLLGQLGWDAHRGRRFLERHFGLASRQQLRDSQLLQFNMLLEEALINPSVGEAPSAGAGG